MSLLTLTTLSRLHLFVIWTWRRQGKDQYGIFDMDGEGAKESLVVRETMPSNAKNAP